MKYLITFLVFVFVFAGTVSAQQPSVMAIAGGENHYIALMSDGATWAWGRNGVGQLGGTGDSNIPLLGPLYGDVVAISVGYNYSLAIKSDGTVWAWGDNTSGQLGNGTTILSTVPIQAIGLSQAVAVAGGAHHSIALKANGMVWAWGTNNSGQLGNPNAPDPSVTALQIPGIAGVVAIAAGHSHSLALKSDGTVWMWGDTSSNGSNVPVQVPGLAGVTIITAGAYYSLALKSDGTVWTWGTSPSVPLQVPGLTGVTTISAGISNSFALQLDGTLWIWSGNSTPVLVSISNVVAIAKSFGNSSLVLKSDGTLWAWGDNTFGQLGNGTFGGSYPNPALVLPFTLPSYLCTAGTVNTAHGLPVNVLFVNGSPGNTNRIVNVAVNAPITVTLAPPPFGPLPAPAVMWAWVGAPTSPTTLTAFGQSLGCMANPPSFMPTLSPQPFTDIPTYAPGLDYNPAGVSFPVVITLQGLMIDFGAGNPTWMSITNAVIVNVQ